MGGRPITRKEIAVASLFILGCILGILYAWTRFGGALPLRPHDYVFYASFDQAANLVENEDVRIAGVTVGKVQQVTPSQGRTVAKLGLYSSYAPLPAGSRAVLRSKTLLGETFVELAPGARGGPALPEYGTLPAANVAPTQQVDQVLSMFDAPTRAALKQLLSELSGSIAGRGPDLNAALGQSNPALADLQRLVGILDRQGGELQQLVAGTGSALRAVAQRGGALRSLVRAGDSLLSATAARDRELSATVNALPPLLGQLRPASGELRAIALDAAPTLATLRPVAPLVRPALAQTSKLAPALTRVFHGVGPLVASAGRGVPAATQLVGAVRSLSDQLDPAGRQAFPVVDLLAAYEPDLTGGLATLGAATESTTLLPNGGRQHVARVLLPIVADSLLGSDRRYGANRGNAYPAPGQNDKLQAFDCRSSANPTPIPVLSSLPGGGAPPCVTAPPWTFEGNTRSFPQLRPFNP